MTPFCFAVFMALVVYGTNVAASVLALNMSDRFADVGPIVVAHVIVIPVNVLLIWLFNWIKTPAPSLAPVVVIETPPKPEVVVHSTF
jgi:hypothetical protein